MRFLLLSLGAAAWLGLVGSAKAAGDIQAGKIKAASCIACHGPGSGAPPNSALAGTSEDKLLQALKDYKSGKRGDSPIMKTLAGSLSDQDMANLAAYYASLK